MGRRLSLSGVSRASDEHAASSREEQKQARATSDPSWLKSTGKHARSWYVLVFGGVCVGG